MGVTATRQQRPTCPSLVSSYLLLENGPTFSGYAPTEQKGTFQGEVVFTTGMTGYIETLTDPSYTGQLVAFTYPLIGNYGVPPMETWESKKIHVSGVLISELCTTSFHSEATDAFLPWLQKQGIPILMGIDTRALTKYIREQGHTIGAITPSSDATPTFEDPNKHNLVKRVSRTEIAVFNEQYDKTVLVIDCGMKENILRSLLELPVCIKCVPYDYDYSNEEIDGLFLSNGPGDPEKYPMVFENIQKAIKQEKPIFGICLGMQMLAKAAGASTYKLPYGHRGHNQPCINLKTKQCFITSQNHGYAVAPDSLSEGWEVTYRNLNDDSVEGIAHKTLPFFGVQFHPEARPGPTDTKWMFQQFYDAL